MRKTIMIIVLCGLVLTHLTGCSPKPEGQDPAKMKVELASEPAAVQAGQKVKLIATISGLAKGEEAGVQFDIRKSDNTMLPDTKEASPSGNGQYSVDKVFDKPGAYSIYIHVYQGDLHITKKKELQVS
ncbi:Ig-like domain repeat protein [Paenibacillus rigui]|uniref:YtkA-like domain-containing protein n=1 Tax=Paenibacillus rigui TaxID=554312 RepID=A0A229UI24_9BACL|nr:Ig-like domain repeat protein [Paenibacillus rigui]OXM83046.1 hypothetical protein CF651_27930 [Paenibacillus rigui]